MKLSEHLYSLTKQMVSEEKKKRQTRREKEKQRRWALEQELTAEAECRKKGFDTALGIVSAIAVPAAVRPPLSQTFHPSNIFLSHQVTTSFFGMNLADLPLEISYQAVLIACCIAAIVFLGIFSVRMIFPCCCFS